MSTESNGGRFSFDIAMKSLTDCRLPGGTEPDGRMEVMIRLAAMSCMCVLLAGCTTGKPGTTNRPYTVYAESRAELSRSVRANAPRSGRAYGLVSITFHPDYDLVAREKGCKPEVRGVGLELVVVLPEWRRGKPVPRPVKRQWTRFHRTIHSHEKYHIRIARDYAERMRRSIAGLRSNKNCGDLSRRIKARINHLKQLHIRAHERYDKREKRRIKALLDKVN